MSVNILSFIDFDDYVVTKNSKMDADNSKIFVLSSSDASVNLSGYSNAIFEVTDRKGNTILTLTKEASTVVLGNGFFHLNTDCSILDVSVAAYNYKFNIVDGSANNIFLGQGHFNVI